MNIGDNVGDKSYRVVVEFESRKDAEECYKTLKELWYDPDFEECEVAGIFGKNEVCE